MYVRIDRNNLEACPFCGGEAALVMSSKKKHEFFPFRVTCQRCFCTTDRYENPEWAIERWNRRECNDSTQGDQSKMP